ncbi:MAG: T9SS type A sorting domain-containing protein [Vicingaceae bacterium]
MLKKLLFTFCLFYITFSYAQYNVSTYSGSGITGHMDGGKLQARFDRPVGIASDNENNLYICDFANHCIRKVDTAGTVSTIAGSPGISGFANGVGTAARFNQPGGICLDNIGNIYVTDNFNNRIRKIDTTGNVTTIVGSGAQGYVDSTGLDAVLNVPRDICIDSSYDFLYFVDRNNVVRKLELGNSRVSTFAGDGVAGYIDGSSDTARFDFPASVDIDDQGNIYVADRENHAIRKIDTAGVVSTIAGNGSPGFANGSSAIARFNRPVNTDLDEYGNIYVSDFSNRRIRKINTNNIVSTFAGDGITGLINGPADTSRIGEVFDIEVIDSNTVFFTDASNDVVRLIKQEPCSAVYDTLSERQCDSYTSPFGNFTWTSSGIYNDTTQLSNGCDSIVTIDLLIDSNTTVFIFDTTCGTYISPSGKVYSSSGLYQDTIPNVNGCDSLISIFLTINSNNNSSSSLTITACDAYVAPSNRIYNQSGTYNDTIVNSNGCDSIITINLTIDSITNGVTQIGNNLIANQNNARYQWLDCNNNFARLPNDTNQSFSSFYSGSYAVEIRNSCIDTSNCINLTIVGINEQSQEKKFSLSPNPTSGRILLSGESTLKNIQIYSLSGLKIKTILNSRNELDLSYLPEGIYFLNIEAKNHSEFKKLIISK